MRILTGASGATLSVTGWIRFHGSAVTMDQGIYHQQNIGHLSMAVIALKAASNRLADTRPLMSELLSLLPSVKAGLYYSIPNPPA